MPDAPQAAPATLPQMFQDTVQRRGDAPALKAKLPRGGWRTITWAGYARYVHEMACFLLSLGVKKGDRLAIMAPNSPEWAISDLAMQHCGALNAAIYETLAPDKVAYILADSGARVAFAGTRKEAESLAGNLKGTSVELVVSFEPARGALGKQVVDWDDALAQGRAWAKAHPRGFEERWRSVEPSDLACLLYTSGTTGEPKGVMLSHANFVSNVLASLHVLPFVGDETFLSFLPLSHSFERMAGHYVPVRLGCLVAFAESIEKLPENLLEVKPTIMTAVPRLFEKMWARVEAGAREQGKEQAFRKAVEAGREHARITKAEHRRAPLVLAIKVKLFDKLAYAKVRERVGGNIRLFVTGGAHIREDLEWNFTAVGLPILGGYGLTETSPVISVNSFDHWRPGSVGKPIPGVEVRIADDGEILCRGPNVMQGYWRKEGETKKVLEDGWLHTGDIGHLDPDGFLYVTDRKKELFKTSGGKYIAPQPVEDLLRSCSLVAEAVCVGDGRNYVTALLVPNFPDLEAWARKEGIPTSDRGALLRDHRVLAAFHAEVDKVNVKLSKFETVKRFALLPRELTQAEGELTPTLKVKRRVVLEHFADEVEAMYE
jgi:long-chain acyl-CoA synthetase